tara:strand:- start:1962 stop:2684 length:723 start_codon:yes stop_codon:yes gene_type:complete
MNIVNIYDKYIDSLNQDNTKERYKGKENWFHASSSGSCIRKQYYRHVEKVPEPSFPKDTMRLFRLGNLVHDDIQKAVLLDSKDTKKKVYIEKEIQIDDWNVRGFLDLLVVSDNELYDIKTCNNKKFKIISGDLNKFNEPINYYLQLATYAYWYERESGKELSKMSLLYYNKDTSEMHEIEVDKNYIHQAQSYWLSVKEKVNYEPDIQLGVSPREKWECNYCNYYQHCGEGYTDGKRKNFK